MKQKQIEFKTKEDFNYFLYFYCTENERKTLLRKIGENILENNK